MSVINLIPEGKECAISRDDLRVLSGLDDRAMRDQINKSNVLVINNGEGYYKPSPQDYYEVLMWTRTFWNRIRNEIQRVRQGEMWLKEMEAECDLYCPPIEEDGLLG